MNDETRRILLIGDNPFHGISHLSQERARTRSDKAESDAEKADVVRTAIDNGADGFMFSVSEKTLSILENLKEQNQIEKVQLYAIVPYAFEYVRMATQIGTPGLVKRFAKQILLSGNLGAAFGGLSAVLRMNPDSLLKTYLAYELSRIKSSAGNKANLKSLLLHEVITDMSLALDFDWLFKSYLSYLSKKRITPGFNTGNLCYLLKKFREWNIDLDRVVVATSFNEAGFQMNPSRQECEKTLSELSKPIVIAISVLAAGYFKPSEAVNYIAGLKNLKGVAAGASSSNQAREFFKLFNERLNNGMKQSV